MNDQLSATIIPFPVRSRALPAVPDVEAAAFTGPEAIARTTPPSGGREQPETLAASTQRLRYALTGLSNALADQRDATQRWKSALEDLATKMRTLSDVGKFGKSVS